MKRIFLLAFCLLLLQHVVAQDQIVKLNGDELPARVLEITLQEVVYQHPDSLAGKAWRMPKSDIFMIRFANGTKEVFTHAEPAAQPADDLTPEEMYQLGRQDAQRYYKGTGALWGSAASSLVFPYGYAGSATIALIRPRAHSNPVPDVSLLANPDYVRGYESRAHGKKVGKAIAGAGIGTGIIVTAVIIILSTMNWH